MTDEAKKTVTPKLRFPEFREEAAWEYKRLDEVCSAITQGGTPDTTVPEFWNGEVCWLTPAEMGKSESPFLDATDRTITEQGLKNCSSVLLPINSVILSTRAPIGHLAINRSPMAINQGCKGLIPSADLDFRFLYFSLVSNKGRLSDLGAGNTFKELSGSALKSFSTAFPRRTEQQQIAECLSTLDELIGAESQKLDALKAHKEGLMQQLFPREGETLPRLRFPEFHDTWAESTLGALSASISSGRDDKAPDGKFDLYGSTGVIGKTCVDTFVGTFLLVARVGANAGYLAKTSGSFGVTDNTLAIDLIEKRNSDFIFYYLGNLGLNKMVFGSGQPLITGGQLKALPVLLPCKSERERIGSCLSSLDDLIAAQSNKLEALKTHKKGLMQQLFPSPVMAEG